MLLDLSMVSQLQKALDPNAGLLLAYEKTGYDTTSTKRLPDCFDVWSAKRIKEQGVDAVKFLLYYDVGTALTNSNQEKQAFTSNASVQSVWRKTFHSSLKSSLTMKKKCGQVLQNTPKVKPHKVIGAMKVLFRPTLQHRCLESSSVNIKYVEGFW